MMMNGLVVVYPCFLCHGLLLGYLKTRQHTAHCLPRNNLLGRTCRTNSSRLQKSLRLRQTTLCCWKEIPTFGYSERGLEHFVDKKIQEFVLTVIREKYFDAKERAQLAIIDVQWSEDRLFIERIRYITTLPRPPGLVLIEKNDGVYVYAVESGGQANICGVVRTGDKLMATSSVFGDDLWEAKSLARTVTTMRTRKGDSIRLILEREICNGNLFSPYCLVSNEENSTSRVESSDDMLSFLIFNYLDLKRRNLPCLNMHRILVQQLLIMMKRFIENNQWHAIEELYYCLRQMKIPLDSFIFHFLLSNMGCAQLSLAKQLLIDATDGNINIDWNIVIQYWKKVKQDVSKHKDVTAATHHQTSCNVGKTIFEMFQIVAESRHRGNAYCDISIQAYNSLLATLLACRSYIYFDKVVSVMQSNSIEFTAVTWNQVLRKYMLKKEYGQALDIIQQGISKGSLPLDNHILTTGLKICKLSNNIEFATWLMSQVEEFSIVPDIFVYNAYIECLGRSLQWKKMLELLQVMEKSSSATRPDCLTYCLIIRVLCLVGQGEEACVLFEKIKSHYSIAPPHVYSCMMSMYARHGDLEKVLDLLRESMYIIQQGQWNELSSYEFATSRTGLQFLSCTMKACIRANKPYLALDIYEDMKQLGCQPDRIVRTLVIEALAAQGDLDKAWKQLVELYKEETSALHCHSFHVFMEYASYAGQFNRLQHCLEMMLNTKPLIAPTRETMKWLSGFSTRVNRQSWRRTDNITDVSLNRQEKLVYLMKIIQLLENRSFKANGFIYCAILDGCIALEDWEQASYWIKQKSQGRFAIGKSEWYKVILLEEWILREAKISH